MRIKTALTLLLGMAFMQMAPAFALEKSIYIPRPASLTNDQFYIAVDKVAIKNGFPQQLSGRAAKALNGYNYADKTCVYDCQMTSLIVVKGRHKKEPVLLLRILETRLLTFGDNFLAGLSIVGLPFAIAYQWPKNRTDRPVYQEKLKQIAKDLEAEFALLAAP